jgi:DinB family protein
VISAATQQNDGREEFLDDFRETIELASSRLLVISEADSGIPRSEGKWSPKEIIGHLIDSAANNHQRFVRAQFTDELVFAGYEQEQWVQAQHYQDEPWNALVQLWQFYNRHLLHVITLAPIETRTKLRHKHNLHKIASDQIKEDEPVTLEFFMRDYLEHMKKHLKQILG